MIEREPLWLDNARYQAATFWKRHARPWPKPSDKDTSKAAIERGFTDNDIATDCARMREADSYYFD